MSKCYFRIRKDVYTKRYTYSVELHHYDKGLLCYVYNWSDNPTEFFVKDFDDTLLYHEEKSSVLNGVSQTFIQQINDLYKELFVV
jgi:hypothetical protein